MLALYPRYLVVLIGGSILSYTLGQKQAFCTAHCLWTLTNAILILQTKHKQTQDQVCVELVRTVLKTALPVYFSQIKWDVVTVYFSRVRPLGCAEGDCRPTLAERGLRDCSALQLRGTIHSSTHRRLRGRQERWCVWRKFSNSVNFSLGHALRAT